MKIFIESVLQGALLWDVPFYPFTFTHAGIYTFDNAG